MEMRAASNAQPRGFQPGGAEGSGYQTRLTGGFSQNAAATVQ